jgi:hypothetical protein
MNRTLGAGLLYGLAVFGLGFILGTARELWLAPLFGRDAVVLVEGPLILVAAWLLCWWIIRRLGVPASLGSRLAMGALALMLLLAGEALVAVFGFGRTLAAHFAAYATVKGVLELLPQMAFALFPLLHLLRK